MPKPSDSQRIASAFRNVNVVHTPGMADRLMKEVAPLLAAEGIDLNDPDTFDVETLNAALARAIDRRNFELMVATGERLSDARAVLRVVTQALGDGQRELAEDVIWSVEPEPTDTAKASVGQVIGVSAGLVDVWHSDPDLDRMLSRTVVPGWGSRGRAAAADILALAKKGRAFDSIGVLHRRHSGIAIIEGGALAVAGTLIAMSKSQHRELREVTAELLASKH
jgi:hypothetical protein